MENNRTIFRPSGHIYEMSSLLEIQISNCGSAARYRRTIHFTCKDDEVVRGRWQEIKYSIRKSRAYIMMNGSRLYLDQFMRNNNVWGA